MSLGRAKNRRDRALQGTLALCLLVLKPVLWLGTLIEACVAMSGFVRAGEAGRLEPRVGENLFFFPRNRNPTPDLLSPKVSLLGLEALERLKLVTHISQPGDSLERLFARFGLSEGEKELWARSVRRHYPPKSLPAGKEIRLYFVDTGQEDGKSLKALEIELDEKWVLAWERGKTGIVFTRREKPYDVELKTVGGVIEKTLFEDGLRAGLNSTLVSQLVDIFSWEIDFDREIRKGDTFKVLYEQKLRKGKDARAQFRILAAELISAGQRYFAIYFEKERGKGSYYDLDGRSLARAFLRFPLEFTSITSRFSSSRVHPVLGLDRPHTGVDFAAPMGTPVRAVAEGEVVYAGWRNGGYGRLIEIQHGRVYSSRYAHLKGFAQGIRKGVRVKKGQLIGYVGSSGLSNGPHLHFELYRNREYVDPLRFVSPREEGIEPALLRLFETTKRLFLAELAATPHS